MDKDTRFMLASQITKGREVRDASRLLSKAKRIAKTLPHTLVTDGLGSYQGAWLNQLCENRKPRPKHIRKISFAGVHNNNLVERLNGTKRERDKVLRGMKKTHTPIRKGFDLYYNFIRPHQGLEGKTPAEVAGIGLQEGNKWKALIEKVGKKSYLAEFDLYFPLVASIFMSGKSSRMTSLMRSALGPFGFAMFYPPHNFCNTSVGNALNK